ncbi:MAG: nuclear transport factor 2 family protein [Acidiferrobacterales bacterium]
MSSREAESIVIELESRLLSDEFRSSYDFLDKILHEDFLEIGASGTAYNKKQVIDLLIRGSNFSSQATGFRFFQVAEGVALLTYSLETVSPDIGTRHSVRSSVWKLENDSWKLVYHQGTQTDSDLKPSE